MPLFSNFCLSRLMRLRGWFKHNKLDFKLYQIYSVINHPPTPSYCTKHLLYNQWLMFFTWHYDFRSKHVVSSSSCDRFWQLDGATGNRTSYCQRYQFIWILLSNDFTILWFVFLVITVNRIFSWPSLKVLVGLRVEKRQNGW